MNFICRIIAAATGTIAIALCASGAFAALGAKQESVAHDRQILSASRHTTKNIGNYNVEEMTIGATTVREYLSSDGTVFAVAWNGYTHPDLSQLLGTYAGEYAKAEKTTARVQGRRWRRIVTDSLVVEHRGHMRDLHGRAYLPALVPGSVRVDEIR